MQGEIKRKVKLVTEQNNIDKESPVPEFPMKEWSVRIYLLDQDGNEHPANCFTKVTYNLHPSFANPNQTFTEPPFTCKNEGWGEFEMSIDMFSTEKGGKNTVFHDLNFQSPRYEVIQTVNFKNPSQSLLQILKETGSVANDDELKAAKIRKATDGEDGTKNDMDNGEFSIDLMTMPEHLAQMVWDFLIQQKLVT